MRAVRAVLAVILLAIVVAIAVVVVDERCSQDLDGVDLTWEEVVAQK